MSAIWIYPFIVVAGVLQAAGNVMNAQLRNSLANPWLASVVSFMLIVGVFVILFACLPRPLPTQAGIESMPWWAPLGGIVGAVAVFAGLVFVDRIGAGPFAALLISANLIFSLVIDQFGLLNMPVHTLTLGRVAGGALMIVGVVLVSVL